MTLSLSPRSVARKAAASAALALVATVGFAGVATAQDQHSGGVSPETESRDPGSPDTEVLGVTISRGADGLPVTGSDVAGLAVLGAAAVAAGTGAVVVSRRRSNAVSA